jgi:hypothetical protein
MQIRTKYVGLIDVYMCTCVEGYPLKCTYRHSYWHLIPITHRHPSLDNDYTHPGTSSSSSLCLSHTHSPTYVLSHTRSLSFPLCPFASLPLCLSASLVSRLSHTRRRRSFCMSSGRMGVYILVYKRDSRRLSASSQLNGFEKPPAR